MIKQNDQRAIKMKGMWTVLKMHMFIGNNVSRKGSMYAIYYAHLNYNFVKTYLHVKKD